MHEIDQCWKLYMKTTHIFETMLLKHFDFAPIPQRCPTTSLSLDTSIPQRPVSSVRFMGLHWLMPTGTGDTPEGEARRAPSAWRMGPRALATNANSQLSRSMCYCFFCIVYALRCNTRRWTYINIGPGFWDLWLHFLTTTTTTTTCRLSGGRVAQHLIQTATSYLLYTAWVVHVSEEGAGGDKAGSCSACQRGLGPHRDTAMIV